jgi:hypothetical protein
MTRALIGALPQPSAIGVRRISSRWQVVLVWAAVGMVVLPVVYMLAAVIVICYLPKVLGIEPEHLEPNSL